MAARVSRTETAQEHSVGGDDHRPAGKRERCRRSQPSRNSPAMANTGPATTRSMIILADSGR
jgi:hypothetical protein